MNKGKDIHKAIQASKIQDTFGEYYVWQMPKDIQDQEVINKMNYIGGAGVVVGGAKIWTNPKEVQDKLREILIVDKNQKEEW